MYFFSKYFIYSKNFYVSLLFLLPMLFLYEVLCFLHYSHKDYQLRNSADVFIKNIFNNNNPSINIFLTFILITLFLWLIYHNYKISFKNGINLSYLFLMIFESIFWSFTLIILMQRFDIFLLQIFRQDSISNQLYLAIGAGIWEEILFRVILIYISMKFFTILFKFKKINSIICSLLLSSLLFSLFHYMGDMGDIITLNSFLLRGFAGLILATIYVKRGFGITAYTHIFYDVIIISFPVLIES